MKRLLVTCGLLLSLCAFSQESSSQRRGIVDLVLFPEVGSTFIGIEYESNNFEYEWVYLGENFSKTDADSNEATIGMIHTFNDKLAASFEVSHMISSETSSTLGPATVSPGQRSETESNGISDPTIGLSYRLLDMSKDKYDMNFNFSLTPKVQDAEIATTTTDGNNGNGGNNLNLGVKWGHRDTSFSWAVGVEYGLMGKAKAINKSNGETTKVDAILVSGLSATGQWKVSEALLVNAGAMLGSMSDYRVTYADGTYLDYEQMGYFGLNLAANFGLSQTTYIVAEISSIAYGEREVKDETGLKVDEKERRASSISLSLLFEI